MTKTSRWKQIGAQPAQGATEKTFGVRERVQWEVIGDRKIVATGVSACPSAFFCSCSFRNEPGEEQEGETIGRDACPTPAISRRNLRAADRVNLHNRACILWSHLLAQRSPTQSTTLEPVIMKKLVTALAAVVLLSFGAAAVSAADTAPKSVIHVVTVAWKEGTTPEQIQAALDGAKALPAAFPGITRVWTKTLKAQNAQEVVKKRTHVIVMEFASEQALKDYADSPAQKKWYEVYFSIRETSTTHDVTN